MFTLAKASQFSELDGDRIEVRLPGDHTWLVLRCLVGKGKRDEQALRAEALRIPLRLGEMLYVDDRKVVRHRALTNETQ